MWLASAALAGATLSKGLIGLVLPGGALVVYTRAHARLRRVAAAPPGVGPRALPRADGALVRRRLARERRVLPVLFRARALPSASFTAATSARARGTTSCRIFVVGMLPWLSILALRRPARVARRRRRTRSVSRGSASRSRGRCSSSCSSARRGRSCRRTSCRCSRRSRSSSAGCSLRLDTRTLMRLSWPLRRGGMRAGAAALRRAAITSCRASPTSACRVLLAFGRWVKAAVAVAAGGRHRACSSRCGRRRRRRRRASPASPCSRSPRWPRCRSRSRDSTR